MTCEVHTTGLQRKRAKISGENTLQYGVLSGCVFNNCYVLLILKALSPSHTGQDNDTIPKKSFAVTLRIVPCSVTANMNLIDERFFWYRYRVQCDRGLKL